MNGRTNVTMLENIMDLDDLENSYGNTSGMNGLTQDQSRMSSKHIRNHTRESHNGSDRINRNQYETYKYGNGNSNQGQIYVEEPVVHQKEYYDPTPIPVQLNCIDVCNHISGCPLCSKFYHNDNTLLIIIIVVLLILVVILTRKVLNL